jgi:hypothetical protein
MILNIDTAGKEFVVTREPQPKLDQAGVQRGEKNTGDPMWSTEVVVTDESGGEILKITTVGSKPDVVRGDEIIPVTLTAIPWTSNGRSGIAYRAEAIKAYED